MSGRRDFLKLLGAALGSAVLTGCGGGEDTVSGAGGGGGLLPPEGGGGTPLPPPNSFSFSPLIGSGAPLPGGVSVTDPVTRRAANALPQTRPSQAGGATLPIQPPRRNVYPPFSGQLWLSDRGELFFAATDTQGLPGVYRGERTTGSPTRLTNLVKVVRQQDRLDGSLVVRYTICDVNPVTGSVLFHAELADQRDGLYLFRNGSSTALVRSHERLPSIQLQGRTTRTLGRAAALSGPNDDLVAVLPLTGVQRLRRTAQCLLYLPSAAVGQAQVLLSTEDVLPDTGRSLIRHLSAVHLSGTRVLVMGVATPAGYTPRFRSGLDPTTDPRPTFMLSGQLGSAGAVAWRLLSADRSLDVSAARTSDGSYVAGRHVNVPRGGPGHAILVHDPAQNLTRLVFDGRQVLTAHPDGASGSRSPLGFPILGLRSPCVDEANRLLVYARTTGGSELLLVSGQSVTTVLASGDSIEGKTVAGIAFGVSDRGASQGSFCCRVRYSDDSSQLLFARPV